MSDQAWLVDTRISYDTVAVSYADILRDALSAAPYERGTLATFAELVRAGGGGPVADVGCGPGRLTAYLAGLGLDAFGIDLSPGMIEVARRDHPGLRFEVGSMTDLDLPDASLGGLLAWWSLIHVPDHEIPAVLDRFRRALRPGAPLMVGFFDGDETRHKTEGYGGHPMNVRVYFRPRDRVSGWLRAAGFTVEAEVVLAKEKPVPGAILFARHG